MLGNSPIAFRRADLTEDEPLRWQESLQGDGSKSFDIGR